MPRSSAPASEGTELYRVFQESISDAHRNWQANLAKGHEDFLKTMESAYFAALGAPVATAAAPVTPALCVPSRSFSFLSPPGPLP